MTRSVTVASAVADGTDVLRQEAAVGRRAGSSGGPPPLFGVPTSPRYKREGGEVHVMVPLRLHSVGLLGGSLPVGFREMGEKGVAPRHSARGLNQRPGGQVHYLFIFFCPENDFCAFLNT